MARLSIATLLLAWLQGAQALTLPPLSSLADYTAVRDAHAFSRTANWLIPGRVLCGHYPGSCPSRPADAPAVASRLAQIREEGVNTFVCLQDELPPQDAPWPDDGVPKSSDRAKWATAHFLNYREQMLGPANDGTSPASFVHFGLPDLSVAPSLEALDSIVRECVGRLVGGEQLYIHCWGGRGRTGLVAACVLGALYTQEQLGGAEEALTRVQTYYETREPTLKTSPETEEQRDQVRGWFSSKRAAVLAAFAAPSVAPATPVVSVPSEPVASDTSVTPASLFGIWSARGDQLSSTRR